MRLLFLSNLYPPHANGGYEQLCEETARELARRGHSLCVLTSRPRRECQPCPTDGSGVEVRRLLNLEVEAGVLDTTLRLIRDRQRLEQENLRSLREVVGEFQPDAAMVWGMWNVPRSVPALVESLLPGRVAYYFCDYWPSLPSAYRQQLEAASKRTLTCWPKRAVARLVLPSLSHTSAVPLRIERPICVSHAVRRLLVEAGVPLERAQVVHLGIDLTRFRPLPEDRASLASWRRDFRLVYAGRLAPEKGVRTVVEALAQVPERPGRTVSLDIVGGGDEGYVAELKAMSHRYHLDGRVAFRGRLPRSDMPLILARHDALVFPSEWQEPFAHTVLEAMAVGIPVIGTTTGGTGEVLVESETGLTFPAGDAERLAAQIQRLADDPTLGRRLARAARERVEREFTIERTVDELEDILEETAREGSSPRTALRL